MAKHFHKGDATHLRWKVIDASRAGGMGALPQLLARLDGDESYDTRRHIVRALGNIGGQRAEARLIALLGTQRGLILGDIAHSLGKLNSRASAPALKGIRAHESEWVRQNVRFALRRLTGDG